MAQRWFIEHTGGYTTWKVRRGVLRDGVRPEHIFESKKDATLAAERMNTSAV